MTPVLVQSLDTWTLMFDGMKVVENMTTFVSAFQAWYATFFVLCGVSPEPQAHLCLPWEVRLQEANRCSEPSNPTWEQSHTSIVCKLFTFIYHFSRSSCRRWLWCVKTKYWIERRTSFDIIACIRSHVDLLYCCFVITFWVFSAGWKGCVCECLCECCVRLRLQSIFHPAERIWKDCVSYAFIL